MSTIDKETWIYIAIALVLIVVLCYCHFCVHSLDDDLYKAGRTYAESELLKANNPGDLAAVCITLEDEADVGADHNGGPDAFDRGILDVLRECEQRQKEQT